mmetsp:Transcript_19538/g.24095  ORF Transcript_19538/g.24095 Transcript_19538/m.24095 type:complete len:213 (+) Transcript_19538:85-723(+)
MTKYNINWLKEKYDSGEKIKYTFFFGHRKKEDGRLNNTCLSQFWEQPFFVDGREYKTAEHWMMARKAELFNDQEALEKIYNACTPNEAKALGRIVQNFDQKTWDEHCYEIVKQGNLHKFSQNDDLQLFLLKTSDCVLVESSPFDKIWGIGIGKKPKGHNQKSTSVEGPKPARICTDGGTRRDKFRLTLLAIRCTLFHLFTPKGIWRPSFVSW